MHIRPASHAGSWYSGDAEELGEQTQQWLAEAQVPATGRFAVGPHAGLRYCGRVLAHTYAALDPGIERVVLLGPSHLQYFQGAQTTQFHAYATPLGNLAVDRDVVKRLVADGCATHLHESVDVREHCLEMHTPFIAARFPRAQIVPVILGAESFPDDRLERFFRPYVADPKTAFVVSSDFCHWGRHFAFQPFKEDAQIYAKIEALDKQGMDVATTGASGEWRRYIESTGNTVCGERPLWFLLKLLESAHSRARLQWLAYSQSSQVQHASESSVSYAAAVAL